MARESGGVGIAPASTPTITQGGWMAHVSPATRRGVALAAALIAASTFVHAPAAAQGIPLGSPIPDQPLGQALAAEPTQSFLSHQLSFARVSNARLSTDHRLRTLFAEKGLDYPAREVFIRVFKHERILQLWARSHQDQSFSLVTEYAVCALPGQLGPKRRMGDLQVPEGFYFIDEFNPTSAFHLSLRVDYPNLADRLRRQAFALGGDIFIHGGCETIGCVPIEDHNIQELYWVAAQAMDAGQKVIPVHIFPARLDPQRLQWLAETFRPEPELLDFWRNLADGYTFFERTGNVPWVTVAQDGRYAFPDLPAEPEEVAASEEPVAEEPVADVPVAEIEGDDPRD
jgi:murein L,D-transpeptidase YafK